ncbi:MAG: MFS transporter [Sedimentibacter sp.]|uniref:MFS transporter n=1 Tax=Sedimentibacter sp. TaxID=1960295 RepID=UPI002981F08A|nr:MFS transporter [Sedimentibacter sp.]MDW5299768.1 MFS transporter [Sedimentibacter sp.]
MKTNGNKIFLIFTLFYLYFIMALFESSRGNFIPFFLEEFHINNTEMSLILSLNTVGCVIGSFLGGQFCEKFGHKFVYIIGSVISTIAVLIAPFTSNVFILGLFNLIFGIGRSSISVAVDSMVPVISIGFESILMNITHFMYGFGSFTGQSAYGKLLSIDIPWRTIYLYLGIFFIVSVILTLFIKTPNIHVIISDTTIKKEELYKEPIVYMFVLAVTFALISETVINTWFISYVRSTYSLNPASAAKYASIFFLMFALGRLLGGFIVNKIGSVKGLKIFLFLGAACLFTGLQFKQNGLMLIALSGFFISISFPTIMVIVNSIFKQNSSFAIGLIVTLSNILYVVIFNITGALNDLLGSYKAFYAAPLSVAGCLAMLILITNKINKKNTI